MDQYILAITEHLDVECLPSHADGLELLWAVCKIDQLNDYVVGEMQGKSPSLALVDYSWLPQFFNYRSQSLEEIPVIVLLDPEDVWDCPDFIDNGIIDFIRLPISMEDLQVEIQKVNHLFSAWRTRLIAEARYQEKTTILETILDILSHDTKNVFVKIYSLLQDLGDKPVRGMLQDTVDELNNITKEAVGYLGNNRRIISVLETVKNIRLTAERIPLFSHSRIELTHQAPELFFAECSDLFKNAITNIAENALKYTPDDGLVTVSLEYQKGRIYIGISDQGSGIPDEEKTAVFERYFRRDKTADIEGSGRGLWITKNIIEKEGGAITVSDNPWGGSLFVVEIPSYQVLNWDSELDRLTEWFDLPLPKIKEKSMAIRSLFQLKGLPDDADLDSIVFTSLLDHLRKETHTRNSAKFKRKLLALKKENPEGVPVLIADDSAYVHYYLATFLVKLGYKITGYARDGLEAVNYYCALKPEIITLDCTMPVMSGIEAARKIYTLNRDVRILFITGLGDSPAFRKDINALIPEGCYRIITKPFKEEVLINALKELQDSEL